MLRTYETQPQLIVSVGDLPAVCHNLTCDFSYIEAQGQVTSFSFDESTKKLVIQGENLPNEANLIQEINFA